MEFVNKMNANKIYKKLSELEEGKEYEILDYDLKYISALDKHILNVTINVDGNECSVGLPDKIRKQFEAQGEFERDKIIGLKFMYVRKLYTKYDGPQVTYYNVTFIK